MPITSALAISLLAPAVPAGGDPPPPVTFQVQYDPAKLPADPLFAETIANLIYPVGKGPVSMGYAPQALPATIFFRGGNTNSIELGELEFSLVPQTIKDFGFVGIDCNFAVIGPDEDMAVSVASLALLVQYLRHNHAELNISPERIFTEGRSAGTLLGYGLALKADHQDLSSPEPQHHWSSRPDYFVPRFGPSNMTCFTESIGPWETVLTTFLFAGGTFAASTPAERLQASPTWWLLNPQAFGRESTPPMCVVSHWSHQDTCGLVYDPHSGIMGDLMIQAIEDFAEMTGRGDYLEDAGWVDSSVIPDPVFPTIGWSLERLADDFDGLHLLPPAGVVGNSGGSVTLTSVGGTPFSTVSFYSGTAQQAQPVAGCPGADSLLAAPTALGTSAANQNGVAALTISVPAGALGTTVLFQAIDHGTCETSGVEVHTYY